MIVLVNAPDRTAASVAIADGQSLSPAVDLGNNTLVGVSVPAANWTSAALTFQGSNDNSAFVDIYDAGSGAEFATPSLANGDGCAVDPSVFLPWRYIKVRSGTSGTPVAQAGGDSVTLISRPF